MNIAFPRTVIINHRDPLPPAREGGDYLVEVRVRNLKIVEALADLGLTPSRFANTYRLSTHAVYGLVNMTASPYLCPRKRRPKPQSQRRYTKASMVLMAVTRRSFDELFNEQQARRPLTKNRRSATLTEAEVIHRLTDRLPALAVAGLLGESHQPGKENLASREDVFRERDNAGHFERGLMNEVLQLSVAEGLSASEIAKRLGARTGRIENLMAYAKSIVGVDRRE